MKNQHAEVIEKLFADEMTSQSAQIVDTVILVLIDEYYFN